MNFSNLSLSFIIEGTTFSTINYCIGTIYNTIANHTHSDSSYEIHYILSGNGTLLVNHKKYELNPGTLYVTGPQIEHEQISDPLSPMEEACLYVQIDAKSRLSTAARPFDSDGIVQRFVMNPFWIGMDCSFLSPYFLTLEQELSTQKLGYDLQAQSIITQIFVHIVRLYTLENNSRVNLTVHDSGNNRLLTIENLFLHDYKTITLSSLSTHLGICTRQVERLIQTHYKMTFSEKRMRARTDAALTLLRDTKWSLEIIADTVGFSSVGYFIQVFKKHHVLSPKVYREQMLNDYKHECSLLE